MSNRVAVALLLILLTSGLLYAHDLFLKLGSYYVPAHTTIRVAVLNGTFDRSEGAVTPDRLRDLTLLGPPGREQVPRDLWKPVRDTTWLTLMLGPMGTYVLGASLRPRELALSADDFNSYLREDGIPDVLEARERSGELARPVRERYQKHVKAVFQVGPRRSGEYMTALGYPAEIVPLANPYLLTVGDTLAFRCLVDGKPVAAQLVIAGGEQDGKAAQEVPARSDTTGIVRFALGRPGKWYVKFIHMVPVRGDSVDYESKWATLTFEIR